MDHSSVVSAYAPFVEALRTGGFTAPDDAWTAELIAAHIALNNESIAFLAEQIAAGDQPSYDNTELIEDAALRAYADSVGDLEGLATAVEHSAACLATARAALDPKTAAVLVPARILDADVVVRDGPIPIGGFIEANASVHIDRHLEQLLALRP